MTWVPGRGRPMLMPVDHSSLRAQKVDVDARVAWLLRINRIASPTSGTAADFSRRLGEIGVPVDGAGISRMESGQRPVPAEVISAYEKLLGLPDGWLLGVCDSTCRTLSYHSIRPARELTADKVRLELDRLSEVIRYGQPTGGDWLSLAHLMTQSGGIVLPQFLEDQWLYQLIDEMARSAGGSYITRLEAMSRVMTSTFGAERLLGLTLDRIRETGVQAASDVMHVWGDGHDRASVDHALQLLTDDNSDIQRGAALALLQRVIENRLSDQQLRRLRVSLRELARDDRPESGALAYMVAHRISPHFADEITVLTGADIGSAPGTHSVDETPASLDLYLGAAREQSGLERDHMLERLLRESFADDFPERRFQARMMIGASPYAPMIAETAVSVLKTHEDSAAQQVAGLLLTHLSPHVSFGDLEPMLESHDVQIRQFGLVALAHGPGIRHDLDLHAHLLDEQIGLKAAYAAGMSCHPDLDAARKHRLAPPPVRQASGWWAHRGGRVDDAARSRD